MKTFEDMKNTKKEIQEYEYKDNIIIYTNKVTYLDRLSFIDTIKEIAIAVDNDVEYISDSLAFKLLDYLILTNYTNLKEILRFKEDDEETLQNILIILDNIGLAEIESIKSTIQRHNPFEIEELEKMLEYSLNEVKELRRIKNSSVYQIVDFLRNLDFSNMEELNPIINKLQEFEKVVQPNEK